MLLLFAFFCFALSYETQEEIVEYINHLPSVTWTAGLNERSAIYGATPKEVKKFLGALKGGPLLPVKTFPNPLALPTQFDSATNWPQCWTMTQIRDQSACGSCWAFGAVEAMSDRTCIFLGKNISLSSAAMAFCCSSCGFGCGGGYPTAAWQYYQTVGVVEEGCWPYPFPSCDHHIPGSKNPCPPNEYPSANCAGKCQSAWNGPNWNNDLHFASSVYTASGESDIMQEIFKNGPVETAFTVYEDFLTYKSGVYQHTTGGELGGHAVKMVGWGVENGTPYWKVANSWNPSWGDKGYFKILRGSDECGIEDQVCAGIPKN